MNAPRRPRIALLVDARNWAYDNTAQYLIKHLSDRFEFRAFYVREAPDLSEWPFDLLFVFFWGETWHQRWQFPAHQVIKHISSHRWETDAVFGHLTAAEMHARFLPDAATFSASSQRLARAFAPYCDIRYCRAGTDFATFFVRHYRKGPVRFGWAGNVKDASKGVQDVLLPAIGSEFEVAVAGGTLSKEQMAEFYNSIDVLLIASQAEGEPLTLLEGLACGVFPVAVDVGIVPELVHSGDNGLIVRRTPDAFRAALQWCRSNPDAVRSGGYRNAQQMALTRNVPKLVQDWEQLFLHALAKAPAAGLPSSPP